MDDLISRAAAIEAMERAAYWNDAKRKITELPAVDAIPVEWLKKVRKDASEGDSLDVGIAEVLDMWQKEQEAQDG